MQHYDSDIHAKSAIGNLRPLTKWQPSCQQNWAFLDCKQNFKKNGLYVFLGRKAVHLKYFFMKYTFVVFHIHTSFKIVLRQPTLIPVLWSEMWQ